MGLATLVSAGRAAGGDEQWDYRFGRVALDGAATTVARFRGELVAGGTFWGAGQRAAMNIARWDGREWWPVGEGLSKETSSSGDSVVDLAVWRDALYAVGFFNRSGDQPLPGLARWDGAAWSAVSGMEGGEVYRVLTANDALYLAGSIRLTGSANRYGVVRWDGSAWETFASRLNEGERVGRIAVRGDDIFATGAFLSLGDAPVPFNAWWNGRAWAALPGLTNRTFRTLAIHQGELYATGSFTVIGGTAAGNLARFDGDHWHAVGGGFDAPPDDLLPLGDELLACGGFRHIGDTVTHGVAAWDGTAWRAIGGDVWPANLPPRRLCDASGERLFAAGNFRSLGADAAGGVAEWTGTQWQAVAAHPALAPASGFSVVYDLIAKPDATYIAGVFDDQHQAAQDMVQQYTEAGRNTLEAPFRGGRIHALAHQGSDLFAGGGFNAAGDTPLNHVARWDGKRWKGLGGGMDSSVFALAAADGPGLFAGGAFSLAGGTPCARIAVWDGTGWSPLGTGIDGSVIALAWADDRLYAGGLFTRAGDVAASCVACWNGEAWESLGTGLGGENPFASAICVNGSDVYVGGRFTTAGGVPVNHLARWDGSQWHPVGTAPNDGVTGSPPQVLDLAFANGNLYVAGDFTVAGTQAVTNLARFDGTTWSPLGSGLHDWAPLATRTKVYAIAWQDNALWVGGTFPVAGNKAAAGLARWIEHPQIELTSPQIMDESRWRVPLTGVLGLRYRVESSPDFRNWTTVGRGAGETDAGVVRDSGPVTDPRFYRAMLEP
jgi:hypothetical protein